MRTSFLFLLSCFACWAQPDMDILMILTVSQQAPVDVLKDSVTGTATQGGAQTGRYGNRTYTSDTSFVAGSTYTLHSVAVPLFAVGTPTFNITAYILTNNGTMPTNIATGDGSGVAETPSSTVAASSISATTYGTATDIGFSNMVAKIVAGGTYWIVLKTSAVDANNYVDWAGKNGVSTDTCAYGSDGVTFGPISSYNLGLKKTYGQ